MKDVLVNIDVDDLSRAIRFYCEAFGLHVGRRFGEVAVELLGAKVPFYLLLKAPESAAFTDAAGSAEATGGANGETLATRRYQRHWTPVHLDFVVSDVEEALQRAQAAGARREGPVHEHSWGKLALLSDPWGHGFCLLQFSERGYDAVATDPGGA